MFLAPALDEREAEVLAEIEELNEQLRFLLRQNNRWSGELRRTTFARNVQGSNTIEGIHASIEDISAIAAGERPVDLSLETEQALAGYQEAMTFVLQLAKSEFELNPMLVRSLHYMITQHDLSKWPGRFRGGPVYVQQERTGDIVHEGASAGSVPGLIAQLCEQGGSHENGLISAAMLHLNFVLIHPFKDGNGRMARVLQSLALASSHEFAPIFLTIEEYLGRRTQQYYDVLAKVGQANWEKANYSPELARPWVRFMLTAHLNQALERTQRIAATSEAAEKLTRLRAAHSLPERAEHALYIAMFGGTVTRARYIASITDDGVTIKAQTASRDLSALAAVGLLNAIGDRRGRTYVASETVKGIARSSGLGYAWQDYDPFA